jgi:acetyltransferase-like isoleucine patch superfamily enzyme
MFLVESIVRPMIRMYRVNKHSEKIKTMADYDVPRSSKINICRLLPRRGCSLRIGENSLIEGSIVFERPNSSITIGKRTFMNGALIASTSISVGDDVLVAWGVTIVDHDSHSVAFSQRAHDVEDWIVGKKDWTHVKTAPIIIGNKSWIGFNSSILEGVTIGEGAVIGAGSVITKNVEPWTIVAGNPARVIRRIPENER